MKNKAGYAANKKSPAVEQEQLCSWTGAVCEPVGAAMRLGWDTDAQKSLFQPISSHSNFRVTDGRSYGLVNPLKELLCIRLKVEMSAQI